MTPKVFFSIAILLSSLIQLSAQEKNIIWSEDFEGDWSENWYVDIGTWEVGTPTSGPQGAYNENNCAATVLNGNYSEPADSRLIRFSSFVVPPLSENPQLQFWHWWQFGSGDYGEVQIKTQHGNWETISIRFDKYGGNDWYRGSIDLSKYSDSTVQIAFYFHSEPGTWGSPSTGWYIDDIKVVTGPLILNTPEDFESGLGDWFVEKGLWEVGVPTSGPNKAFGGQKCFGTNLEGNYHEPVDSRLITPPFMVPTISDNPRIQFWHWWQFGWGDYGEVQIKTQYSNWETISIRFNNYGGDDWYRGSIDLSKYSDSKVQIAFYFHSEPGTWGSPSTGWYIDNFEIVTGPFLINNPEDFESGLNDWSVEKGLWEIGIPTSGPDNAHGGQNCAGTNLNGNYHEPVDSRLISRPFVIPEESESPALRFWHWFSFAWGDWGEVQITTDSCRTWKSISTQKINSRSSSWSPYYIPLTSYADSTVQFGFYFHSDPGTWGSPDLGWYIDDVRIHDISELSVYAGSDLTLDSCGSTTINATVSGGTEPYVVEWIPARGLDDPASLSPVATPSDTTIYTLKVTDSHGCFRTDKIVVNANCETDNTETEIVSFGFGKPPQSGSAIIDKVAHTVSVDVKYGTDLKTLAASFTLSEGATANIGGVDQQSGYTTNDFSNPVTYTIIAEDGVTVQNWVITVNIAVVESPEFNSYTFGKPPQTGEAFINMEAHTVDIKVENGTDLTNLVATFSLPEGASATVGGEIQESGITANDFTEPVTYTLTAADEVTVQEWVVTVIEGALYETDFLTFSFGKPPQTRGSVINPISHTVDIEVANGTDVSNLVASFTLSDGASVKVGTVDQESGVTANDFTNPVTYAVTASDGETVQDWIVTVDVALAIGIDENSVQIMNIYPNPFSDQTVIEVNNPEQSTLNLSIYSTLGNKVFEKDIFRSGTIELKKGNLAAGIYMVALHGNRVHESRIIIIK